MSKNNVFLTAGEPYVRFVRTVTYGVTGWRLNPDDNWKKLEFYLGTEGPSADYEDTVLELYSEQELKFFKQANRYLFKQGLLRDYHGENEAVDMANVMTDAEVKSIANMRLGSPLIKRLSEITSVITMQRILEAGKEVGRPMKVLELFQHRVAELKEGT